METRQVAAAAAAALLFVCAAQAKPQNDLSSLAENAGASIGVDSASIVDDITFRGLRRIAPAALEAQIVTRCGEALDPERLAEDVRTLGKLAWFAAIRVETAPAAQLLGALAENQRRVHLNFYLEEYPFLTGVKYAGSRLLSARQIDKLLADKKLAAKFAEPENPLALHQIARAIQSALAELGHPEASVQIRRVESPNATVQVHFEITDGPHLPVGRVTFVGHPGMPAKNLRRTMRRLVPDAFFAGLRGKTSYTREAFEEDRERLLAHYQNHGFPEARVSDAQVSKYEEAARRWFPWPQKKTQARLNVMIPVEAGIFYRLASVGESAALQQVVATPKKSSGELPEGVQPGRAYSARAIENYRRAWQARAQPKPRRDQTAAFRNVEALRALDPPSGTVRVKLDLSSTPPYIVRRLEFRGLRSFPDRYFRRRILLKEGAPLDDRVLEAGLARLARTGYFKPIRKEDVHVEANEAAHTADVTIRIEELGQQRASLVGGRGQFGSTLGIAYTVFNLLDREELLSSRIEGGPETLQLAIGFAKESFLGSRGSLALSVFDTFLRPRFSGSAKGPFLKQQSEGIEASSSYMLSSANSVSLSYDFSRSKTQYSPLLPVSVPGVTVTAGSTETSRHAAGLGFAHDTGDERIVFADSVSGGLLGGSENLVRSKMEFGRILRDPIFNRNNSWAFRTTLTAAGSYSGDMPLYARLFAGDESVRGLRTGKLGPQAVVSSISATGATKYSASPAGANFITAANAEYRLRLSNNTEAAGFFDLGAGKLLPNWLGHTRSTLLDSTNGILHGSTGIQLQWTVPGAGVPVRAYYAVNVLRLDRWLPLPDGTLFHAHDRLATFGWALGSLF
jgi:outer membrane protein assembly complex protein YaeT